MIRYFGDFVISTLQHERLKVAKPSELNDPFDFALTTDGEITREVLVQYLQALLGTPGFCAEWRDKNPESSNLTDAQIRDFAISSEEFERILNNQGAALKESFNSSRDITNTDRHFRILCFSNPTISINGDILMWSHYGNSHKGFRLHFNQDAIALLAADQRSVNYPPEKKRVTLTPAERLNEAAYIMKAREAYRTKSECWRYEEELRFFIEPKKCIVDANTQMEFLHFSPDALKRIDLGIHTEGALVSKLADLLKEERYQHVEIYQASMHKTDFSIEYNLVTMESLEARGQASAS